MSAKKKQASVDFLLYGDRPPCSVYLLTPVSPRGEAWATEHLPEDAQRLGSGIAVEHRYIGDIVQGIKSDGLTVR